MSVTPQMKIECCVCHTTIGHKPAEGPHRETGTYCPECATVYLQPHLVGAFLQMRASMATNNQKVL